MNIIARCCALLAGLAVTSHSQAQDGAFFRSGPADANGPITFLSGPSTGPFDHVLTAGDFASALRGPAAYQVQKASVWLGTLPSDPAAVWISSSPMGNITGPTALYAKSFYLQSPLPPGARTRLTVWFVVDDMLGDSTNEGMFLNGSSLQNSSNGNRGAQDTRVFTAIDALLHQGWNSFCLNVQHGAAGEPTGVMFSCRLQIYPAGTALLVPSLPFPTINDALDFAIDGDTILVAPGTYHESINFQGKKLTIAATDASSRPVIFAGQSIPCVTFEHGENRSAVLDGFELSGAEVQGYGGGIRITNASPTVRNCVIDGNVAGSGAGIGISNGAPLISRCVVSGNHAIYSGGGISGSGTSGAVLIDTVVVSNQASGAGGIFVSGFQVANATISDNTSTDGEMNTMLNSSVSNTIVWHNTPPQTVLSASIAQYCDIQGGAAGVGNIDADPLFQNAAGGDWSLTDGSACVDAGSNLGHPGEVGFALDMANHPRFVNAILVQDTGVGPGPIIDIGAYENQGVPICPSDFDQNGYVNGDDFDSFMMAFVAGC